MSRPETDLDNGRFDELERELRRHRPRVSPALLARVERIAEQEELERPSRQVRSPWITRRRLGLAFALALMVALVGAVIAGRGQQTPTARQGTVATMETHKQPLLAGQGTTTTPLMAPRASGDQVSRTPLPEEATPADKAAPITTGKRLAELRADLTIRVESRLQLSNATARAMRIVRSLNGYVVSASYSAPSRGDATSYLELKVPGDKAQEALSRISALGEILAQQINLEDVQRTVAGQTDEIRALNLRIAEIERTLRDEVLTIEARSRLQVQLASAHARLRALELQRTATRRRGQLATISLALTTGDLPKPAHDPGRIEKAFDQAKDGLSAEVAWGLKAVVVASPFLIVGLGVVAVYRLRRRREERRLLDR
jgi:hypothetical protein